MRDGSGLAGGATAYNCRIIDNDTYGPAGGMWYGTANNCIFEGNGSILGLGVGRALMAMLSGTADNCIFIDNPPVDSTVNNCIMLNLSDKTPPARSLLAHNTCSPDVSHGVNGNITNKPMFLDAANNDYRLFATSPCIDAGSNGLVETTTDFEGNPRIIDGDLDGTATVDMGAYEFQVVSILEMEIPPVNLKSKGRTPVTILTTDNFDATSIGPASVRFAGASPVKHSLSAVDGDGDTDLKLHFKTQELGIDPADEEVTLMGQTYGGLLVVGMSKVKVVPSK